MITDASESPAPPTEEAPVKQRPVLGMTPKVQRAVQHVLERVRQNLPPNYKLVAREHGVSPRTLHEHVYKLRKGKIRIGPSRTPEEIEQLELMELHRGAESWNLVAQMLNDDIEVMRKAMQKMTAGKARAEYYRDGGLAQVEESYRKLIKLRNEIRLCEQRIQQLQVRKAVREAAVKDAQKANVPDGDSMTDEDRALRELERELHTEAAA